MFNLCFIKCKQFFEGLLKVSNLSCGPTYLGEVLSLNFYFQPPKYETMTTSLIAIL